MIIHNEGDLFEHVHQAYAHGVSNLGIMGKGIAIKFKEIYPNMFKTYKSLCHKEILKPGDCLFYQSIKEDLPSVFNLVTQDNIFQAKAEFLNISIREMYVTSREKGITDIAMPEIGCGLGSLNLDDLISCLQPFVEDSKHHITIYSIKPPKN
jgi:O-acetyl-ADP-ribose deacetylase (regulator of RNase III)